MHDAHHRAMAARGRIVSEAAQGGLNSRVPFTIANAIDGIHRDAVEQAMVVVRNFMGRMQSPPKKITGWARPHLENLGNTVLSGIHPAGYPGEHQQAVRQYSAMFQQRLDGALRDAEIGFVRGAGFAQAEESAALVTAPPPKEVLSLKPTWLGMSIDLKELWRRVSKCNAR
jgi:hypothetical protein